MIWEWTSNNPFLLSLRFGQGGFVTAAETLTTTVGQPYLGSVVSGLYQRQITSTSICFSWLTHTKLLEETTEPSLSLPLAACPGGAPGTFCI